MSDLSLNISASNLQATVSKGIDNPDETRRPPRAPPSLLKKIEKIGRKVVILFFHSIRSHSNSSQMIYRSAQNTP